MSTKKIFNFYYDLCCQKLTVYSGTSAEEIKSTIREILEIPQDKQVRYLDEEGNPIVISSALPDQIKIYVEIKKTVTEKFLEENKAKNDNNNNTTTSTLNSIKWVWNKDDENIPVGKRHKIKIFIDSDGGSVFAANNLINVIECSETPIVGVAFSVAASAASSILVACNERYAFKHSTILLHDGSVMVQNSGNKARQTMDFLDKVDSVVKDTILKHTTITEEEYEANKKDEQFMFADEAKEKGIIDYIIGVDCTLNEIL